MMIWHFRDISWFPKILSLKLFSNSSGNLWWKENLLNHQKVTKYYEHDCLQDFLLLFMSLLTAFDSYILAGIIFIFLKKGPRPNLKGFQYQIWTLVKRWGKQLSSKTNVSTFLQISYSNFRLKLCQRS